MQDLPAQAEAAPTSSSAASGSAPGTRQKTAKTTDPAAGAA